MGVESAITAGAVRDQAAVSSHSRFSTMDGLRGVAALAVVLFHSFGEDGFMPNALLAVDLFFILSGFVIAFSYDERLSSGMTAWNFAKRRFVRLYPMLIFGALLGAAVAIIHNQTSRTDIYPTGELVTSAALSVVAVPFLISNSINAYIFSFNPPAWSLFFEIVANFVYGLMARRLTNTRLAMIILASLFIIVLDQRIGGNKIGNFWMGFPRVSAGFFAGVLLFRFHKVGALPNISAHPFAIVAAMLAMFVLPIPLNGWTFIPLFCVLAALVVASIAPCPPRLVGICETLGLASYPIYLIHWSTLYVATWIGTKFGLGGSLYPMLAFAHLAAMPVVGYLIARFYETPARLALGRRLL